MKKTKFISQFAYNSNAERSIEKIRNYKIIQHSGTKSYMLY